MGRDYSVTCDVCGLQRGGLNDLLCDCAESFDLPEPLVFALTETGEELMTRMQTLAQNIRIGAALCRAFALGEYFERDTAIGGWRLEQRWAPGCGKPAP